MMKRRDFGFLAGTSLATTAIRPARAQTATPDPSLLKTTLTPMGAERAGNADGSIPAWTGGVVGAPAVPNVDTRVHMFEDEAPLYTVNASNMAQYADLLTEATKFQITNFGLYLKVYKTHRTAAATQQVYDNAALNVTRAQMDPRGGRFGFANAVGAPPFPIINTADPLVGGAQLIWNHLTGWGGAQTGIANFSPGCVVIDGKIILVSGSYGKFSSPYYDVNTTVDNYQGFGIKSHFWNVAPPSQVGGETLVWHSTNTSVHPDIVWVLINGEGRVRKAPDQAFDSPNPNGNAVSNVDEAQCFYGSPVQYNWTYIAKKEMLVPYNCNKIDFVNALDLLKPHFPDPEVLRWEKHRVWVVEADLAPGEHNVNAKRRFYIDEDSWFSLLGEGYDAHGTMVKSYSLYNHCTPSNPSTATAATVTLALSSGNYVYDGNNDFGSYKAGAFTAPIPPSAFDPKNMAAESSF